MPRAAQPVHILTASATARRIVNMTALLMAEGNSGRSVGKDAGETAVQL